VGRSGKGDWWLLVATWWWVKVWRVGEGFEGRDLVEVNEGGGTGGA
jgi:hypothetical protein